MCPRYAIAGLMLIAATHLSAAPAHAQADKLEVRDADSVKTVLERHAGKRVGIVFTSGQEMTGVVSKVTGGVVHLTELSGRELFDAVVALDRISAVVVRVRSR